MVSVRKYVDWLWEREVTAAPGRELILSSDLPKKPEYLPRPLPADNDRELQQKLKDDESKVSLGLYVMRRTGLRIGELRRLERDCVRVDHSGGHFLKVPLGKMHDFSFDGWKLPATTSRPFAQRRGEPEGRIESARRSPRTEPGKRSREMGHIVYITLIMRTSDVRFPSVRRAVSLCPTCGFPLSDVRFPSVLRMGAVGRHSSASADVAAQDAVEQRVLEPLGVGFRDRHDGERHPRVSQLLDGGDD